MQVFTQTVRHVNAVDFIVVDKPHPCRRLNRETKSARSARILRKRAAAAIRAILAIEKMARSDRHEISPAVLDVVELQLNRAAATIGKARRHDNGHG